MTVAASSDLYNVYLCIRIVNSISPRDLLRRESLVHASSPFCGPYLYARTRVHKKKIKIYIHTHEAGGRGGKTTRFSPRRAVGDLGPAARRRHESFSNTVLRPHASYGFVVRVYLFIYFFSSTNRGKYDWKKK